MCGIFGIFGKEIDREKVVYCTDTMMHRGPDGGGVWQSPDRKTSLGHRRLAILDLSEKAKQPMSYANGRFWLTYNGEIYNFVEIRKELQNAGYTFVSDSDSEVILVAYIHWGVESFSKFNGMWAFAIYDVQEKKLLLCRDRYGVKPLFYYQLPGGGVAFASEMKALLPIINDAEPNWELFDFFSRGNLHYENREDCLIKGIKRFPSGHYAIISDNKIEIKRWWNTLDHILDVPKDYDEQVEMFRDLFLDACKIRMRSDVTLGTALSGGLDSSATICAMSKLSNSALNDTKMNRDWQHAYVACFPGSELDERKYAKQVTDYLGIKSTFLDINPSISERDLYHSIYLFEELWNNPQIPMMDIYRQERKEGTTVSLDGHAADELFGGYAFDIEKAISDTNGNISKRKEITKCVWNLYGDMKQKPAESYEKYHTRTVRKQMTNYWAKRILGKDQVQSMEQNHPRWRELGKFDQTLYVSTHETIFPTLLRNYDRNSMANGVEIRMPFLDYRIVNFAFSIDWESKIRNGYSKAIIRDAIEPFAPRSIVRRQSKIGFNAPLDMWLCGAWKELFSDIIFSSDFANSRMVKDCKRVRENWLEYLAGDSKNPYNIWMCVEPYLWERAMLRTFKL